VTPQSDSSSDFQVTVVIPAYNAEPWIAKALDSIAAQTRPVSEVIVVDDGSTDRTADIARTHGASVLQKSKSGVSAARNAGIKSAKTEFIAQLDADDCLEPRFIELCAEALTLRPDTKLLFGNLRFISETSEEILPDISFASRLDALAGGAVGNDLYEAPSDLYTRLLRSKTYCVPSSGALLRRSAAIDCGLYDTSMVWAEDADFVFRLTRQPGAVMYTYETVATVLRAGHSTIDKHNRITKAHNAIYSKKKLLGMADTLNLDSREIEATRTALKQDFAFRLRQSD